MLIIDPLLGLGSHRQVFGRAIMTKTTTMIFVVVMVAVKAVAGTRLVELKEVTTPGAADTACNTVHNLGVTNTSAMYNLVPHIPLHFVSTICNTVHN